MPRVRAADGRIWRVRRRWTHRPRWRVLLRRRARAAERGDDEPGWWRDFLESALHLGGDEGCFTLVIAAVVIAAILALLLWIGIPLILFLVETAWGILVLVAGIVLKVLVRRPWTIEASAPGLTREWQIVGWRASSEATRMIESRLRRGEELPERLQVP